MSVAMKFPAKSAHSSGSLEHKELDVVSIAFADRISIMIYSNGRQGKLFVVDLSTLSAAAGEVPSLGQLEHESLLPLSYITSNQLIGSDFDDVQGRFYANLIGSTISRQAPQERRKLIIGIPYDIGPRENESIEVSHRKELLEIVKLVQETRVW